MRIFQHSPVRTCLPRSSSASLLRHAKEPWPLALGSASTLCSFFLGRGVGKGQAFTSRLSAGLLESQPLPLGSSCKVPAFDRLTWVPAFP